MKRVEASQVVRRFSEFCDEAAHEGERIIITRHGKPIAALVHFEDAEYIEALEEKIDNEIADREMAAHRADPSSSIPAEELFKRFGL